MRKRNKRVSVRLTEAEHAHLLKQVAQSSVGKIEPYLRLLITGQQIKPRPPEDYAALLRELSAIGNNINQIARIANSTHHVEPKDVKAILHMQLDLWQRIKSI